MIRFCFCFSFYIVLLHAMQRRSLILDDVMGRSLFLKASVGKRELCVVVARVF